MKLQDTINAQLTFVSLLTAFFFASTTVRAQTQTSTPTATPTQPPFTERLLTGGGSAFSGLVPAPNGRLYGLTYDGGTSNMGTLYSVDPALTLHQVGSVLTAAAVHVNFNGANGMTPYDEMTFDPVSKKFYGTTDRGGVDNNGTIFSYVPGANTVTTLRNDLSGHYGAIGPLVVSNGHIYGGLGYSLSGVGAIFRMATNGSGFTIIHTFEQFSQRIFGLTLGEDNWLYGVTHYGGTFNHGMVFRLRPVLPGNPNTEFQSLLDFQGGTDGAPQRTVVYGSDGLIYFNSHYRIYRLDPNNPGAGFQTIWTEPGGAISMSIIEGSDGRIYAASYDNHLSSFAGSIFSINRDGTDRTVLRTFSFNTGLKAYGPYGRLYRTPSGTIFGTTEYINEPAPYIGTAFAINPPTPAYVLSGSPDELTDITVDDALDVYQNGVLIYTDGIANSGNRPPIPIFGNPGDTLRFVVRDTYGVCASLTPVYLNATASCGSFVADTGFDLGCGRPPDDQGVVHDHTFTIPQTNAPPVLSNVAITSPVIENGTATLSGSIADPDMGDTFSLTVNWGDASTPQVFNYPAGTMSFNETHQYLDDNPTGTSSDTYMVTLKLRDNGGGCDADSTSVTVNNLAPSLSNISISPATVFVGTSANVSGNVIDAGTQDTHTVVINWGDGTADTTLNLAAGVSAFNTAHQYLAVGSYMIGIAVTDDDTGSANTSVPITVNPLGTIFVNRTDDRDAACNPGGECSLREAIKLANAAPDPNQIAFSPGTFGAPQTIELVNGELAISRPLVITASPPNLVTVRRSTAPGTPDFRPFTVFSSSGIDISVTLSGLTISNGKALHGGGVYSFGFGDLILNDCVITDNEATSSGGGIRAGFRQNSRVTLNNTIVQNNEVTGSQGNAGYGGGINVDFGMLTLNDSIVSGNSLNLDNLRSGVGGGIAVTGPVVVNVNNSKIIDNMANTVVGDSSGIGGGIAIYTQGVASTLSIIGSTISGNITSNASPTSNLFNSGGGLSLGTGTTTIRDSSIVNNLAVGGSNTAGGGIRIVADNDINISNSTISENVSGNFGGGIAEGSGSLILNNVTITRNSASFSGGIAGGNVPIKLRNTIVAENSAPANFPNISGSGFTTNGNNIIGDPGNSGAFVNGVSGDQVGTAAMPLNPQLAPLGLYGGPTFTHTLLIGSVAKDNGNNCVFNLSCAADQPPVALTLDQRGAARQGTAVDAVDVGAVEAAPGFVAALPNGQVNQPVNIVIVPANGGFNFNVANGVLPPGLALNGGAVFLEGSGDTPNNVVSILGTPTEAGNYSFTIEATDAGGDTFSIAYSMTIANATGTPTPTPTPAAMISGMVTYGNAMPEATRFVSNVLISGSGSVPVSVLTGGLGANEGQYSLSGFGTGAYVVTPTKSGGINGAITSFDAAKIALHVAGPPNAQLNPTQLMVADVSGNSSVTSFDAGMIAKFVAGPPYTQPGVGASSTWRFTPANRIYASVSGVTGEDYTALLMGEVSGNWTNTGARPGGIYDDASPSESGDVNAGPEREIAVRLPNVTIPIEKDFVIPLSVEGTANQGIISYEFDLRYDPSVIQPVGDGVDLTDTASRGLSVVTNTTEAGFMRVVAYGSMPIGEDGVLLNLRFAAVGTDGSVSPVMLERILFNEGFSAVNVFSASVVLTGGR